MDQESGHNNTLPWGKRGEYLVIFQFILFFGFIFLPVYPDFFDTGLFKNLTAIRWTILIATWIPAFFLGSLGAYNIKKYLTPLPYPVEDNQLVTTGMYALVRHPLYSSILFAAFGWTFFTMSFSHFCLTLVGFIFFNYKASREERWLIQRHPEYTDYAQRVKRFIPWVY
ncbi:MAG: isoprenylcysteine carboxylmethyltransferase family protein [Chlorobiales bacterium]|nr:isoprenylcysteine carboxylmethyltransferase family protein [Chlorobiales bacterium]